MIQTIVIEDEEKSLHVIGDLITKLAADVELVGAAGSVEKSVQLIESHEPQLVFLDVQLADGTGFDVLRRLNTRNFELIFTTAYDKYALEAFRFSAIDYLLKPIGIPEFEAAVERARKRISEKSRQVNVDTLLYNLSIQAGQDRRIAIATVSGIDFIDLKDICWCSSEGSYTCFHLVNNTKLVSSRNMGYYEALLCTSNFCRIHNAYIINLRFAKSYTRGKSGYVLMSDGAQLEVSQRRKGDFLDRF
jgi:two-component system LytT family response regulator